MDCSLPGSSVPGDSPGTNTAVGCRALLQGIFLMQGSKLSRSCLLRWQAGSLPLAPPGKPTWASECLANPNELGNPRILGGDDGGELDCVQLNCHSH